MQGIKGDRGDAGVQGPAGQTGPAGEQGRPAPETPRSAFSVARLYPLLGNDTKAAPVTFDKVE